MTSNTVLSSNAVPMNTRTAGQFEHRMLFVTLWIVWASMLGCSMIWGNLSGRHSSAIALWTRMGSSIALTATAWIAVYLWRSHQVGMFANLLAVGMTLGTIGDFFNAGLLRIVPLPDPILGGIAAFGLGHLAYIWGCFVLSKRAQLTDRRAFTKSVIAWQLFGLFTWYLVVFLGTRARPLVWPSLGYSALLAGTAGVTSAIALQSRRFFWLGIGGALFLASDLLLGVGMFRGHFPYQTESVWLTYGAAQMLIVFSVCTAKAVLDAGEPN